MKGLEPKISLGLKIRSKTWEAKLYPTKLMLIRPGGASAAGLDATKPGNAESAGPMTSSVTSSRARLHDRSARWLENQADQSSIACCGNDCRCNQPERSPRDERFRLRVLSGTGVDKGRAMMIGVEHGDEGCCDDSFAASGASENVRSETDNGFCVIPSARHAGQNTVHSINCTWGRCVCMAHEATARMIAITSSSGPIHLK